MTGRRIRVGTWNAQWASPAAARGRSIRERLEAAECDLLCVTEGLAGLLPPGGSVIESDADYGYPAREGRRKVLLWSRTAWTEADTGPSTLPGGRFVTGVSETSAGPLRIVGVCVPWRGAHVTTGRKDRARWEDHLRFLDGLSDLSFGSAQSRTIVLGDFNQRIPRKYAPERVHEALRDALGELKVATEGPLPGAPGLAIDHIVHSVDLQPSRFGCWPKSDEAGNRLSDHFGIWCDLDLADG